MKAAEYLAAVVGFAHARQMDLRPTCTSWQKELNRHRTRELDAPLWLWTAVVGLLVEHERLHCRPRCSTAFANVASIALRRRARRRAA